MSKSINIIYWKFLYLYRYIKELKNKIELTFIPNKKYETILYDQFRHFDLDSSGICSLQNFIKVNQRLGVVLKDPKDFEKIFLFFSKPGTSLLFYKEFVKDIFCFTSTRDRKYKCRKCSSDNFTFIEALTRKIMSNKGIFTLIELVKNIKMIDYESMRFITLNDFINALKKSEINLNEEEKGKIFIEYDYYSNGVIKYEILINLILEQFWDEHKNNLTEKIYYLISNNGKKFISLNYIQELFQRIMDDNYSKRKLIKLIDEYKLINNNSSISPISLKDFKKFFKYYSFGNPDENILIDIISKLQPGFFNSNNNDGNIYQFKKYFNESNSPNIKYRHKYSRSMDKLNNINMGKIIKRLRKIFIEYGRKSFFNFIKQFRYYENNERQIDRNNFRIVFNSYNINLSIEEIDIIFNKFSIDNMKNLIFYEDFLKYMAVNSSNYYRQEIIKYVYETIIERSSSLNKDLDLSFLKELYNPKNNFFIKDETDNILEFIDCLEIFHYLYKSFKSNKLHKKEFIDFYRFISFLIYSDNDFISLILNEWRIPQNKFNDFLSNLNIIDNNNNNSTDTNNNLKNYFLLELKNILINKGVKGLINLHHKFMSYSPNISKITIYDFINILQLEHINFDKNNYNEIFNYFSSKENGTYLDYDRFIRFFKKELNDKKLNIVEKIFLSLKYDTGDNKEIPLNEIKKKYNASRHPEVITGKKTEDEKLIEFRESFDINYDINNSEQTNNKLGKFVDFDTFANFYEYVSFIYNDDEDFINLLISTWC